METDLPNVTKIHTVANEVLIPSLVWKCIAMCIGVIGNIIVAKCAIYSAREEHQETSTPSSYLIGNLAVADLLNCISFYPIWIAEFIKTVSDANSDQMVFCKISRSSSWMLLFVSVASLLMTTIDRYIYITRPLNYPQIVTERRIKIYVLGIWFLGCLILVLFSLKYTTYPQFRSLCFLSFEIAWTTTILIGYLPFILLLTLNLRIFIIANQQRKRIRAERKIQPAHNKNATTLRRVLHTLRTVKTVFIIILVFFLCCFGPSAVARILVHTCSETCQHVWYVVINYELYGINSIVNPFIYGMRHMKYRKAYRNFLIKIFRR